MHALFVYLTRPRFAERIEGRFNQSVSDGWVKNCARETTLFTVSLPGTILLVMAAQNSLIKCGDNIKPDWISRCFRNMTCMIPLLVLGGLMFQIIVIRPVDELGLPRYCSQQSLEAKTLLWTSTTTAATLLSIKVKKKLFLK